MPVEPLHDIKEHNRNIFTELPHHLNENELKIFNSTKELVTEGRERLRGCDYRLWAVLLALRMFQKARITVCHLLNTLAELSQLCYAPADKRTPRFIPRFYNVAFLHAITVLKFFSCPKTLTLRKLYGIYWHSLIIHAPCTSRIVSLSAINTEEEERMLADINKISKQTSSGRPDHIIPNSVLRLQAEKFLKEENGKNNCSIEEVRSRISHFATQLPKMPSTSIFGDLLRSEIYQAHLERISDYLLPGEGVWWHRDIESNSVIFHDSQDDEDWRAEGPGISHFRSSSLKDVTLKVKNSWDKCLANRVTLPIERLKQFDEDGEVSCIQTFQMFGEAASSYASDEHEVPVISEIEELEEPEDEPVPVCTSLAQVDEAEYSIEEDCNEESLPSLQQMQSVVNKSQPGRSSFPQAPSPGIATGNPDTASTRTPGIATCNLNAASTRTPGIATCNPDTASTRTPGIAMCNTDAASTRTPGIAMCNTDAASTRTPGIAMCNTDAASTVTELEGRLQTKLANNIFRAVGPCEEVITLDACRCKLRLCRDIEINFSQKKPKTYQTKT